MYLGIEPSSSHSRRSSNESKAVSALSVPPPPPPPPSNLQQIEVAERLLFITCTQSLALSCHPFSFSSSRKLIVPNRVSSRCLQIATSCFRVMLSSVIMYSRSLKNLTSPSLFMIQLLVLSCQRRSSFLMPATLIARALMKSFTPSTLNLEVFQVCGLRCL